MVTGLALRMIVGLQGLLARTRDEDGQTLAEYGLIISVVAVSTILLAVVAFRGAIIAAFDSASACLSGSC